MPLPSGSGAAAAAVATALATLGKDSPAWACFAPSGSNQMVIDSLPMGPPLTHPQVATCTTTIQPTSLQLWRVTLSIRLTEPDPHAGSGETIMVWVNPDGTPSELTLAP